MSPSRAAFVLLSAVGVASYTLPTARVCRASRHAPLQAAEAPAWMKAVQERITGSNSAGQRQPVGDYMSTGVITLTPDQTVQSAAEILADKDISGAPVTDSDGKVVGVLSQFDLMFRAAGRRALDLGSKPRSERFTENTKRLEKALGDTVKEAMTANPITITADSSMQDAAALMVSKKFNRLPVVDEVGSIVGILTSTDVMRLVVSGALELN